MFAGIMYVEFGWVSFYIPCHGICGVFTGIVLSSYKSLMSELDIDVTRGWVLSKSHRLSMKMWSSGTTPRTIMWRTAVSVWRLHRNPNFQALGCRGTGTQRSSCYTVTASPSNPPIEALGRAVNLKRHELGSDYAATASKNRPRAINNTSKLIWAIEC